MSTKSEWNQNVLHRRSVSFLSFFSLKFRIDFVHRILLFNSIQEMTIWGGITLHEQRFMLSMDGMISISVILVHSNTTTVACFVAKIMAFPVRSHRMNGRVFIQAISVTTSTEYTIHLFSVLLILENAKMHSFIAWMTGIVSWNVIEGNHVSDQRSLVRITETVTLSATKKDHVWD